ncbi:hypothetical protein [Terrisporobacter sp.]
MLKEKEKVVSISQILLFLVGILYLLESLFVRGMFTNIFLLMAIAIFAVVALIIVLVKKEFKLAILDILICLCCFGIFNFLAR